MRKHYNHLCLNLNNSKIWRPIPEIFSEIIENFDLYKTYAENPWNVAAFLGRVPLKTWHSTKVAIFEALLYKLCKGWRSRYSAFFRGFSLLPNGRIMIAILALICPPEGPQWWPTWKFDPPWGPNLGVTPILKTPYDSHWGIYISCKFDINTPRGYGHIAHRILARKRKWNQLWEFPNTIIRQNYVGREPPPWI